MYKDDCSLSPEGRVDGFESSSGAIELRGRAMVGEDVRRIMRDNAGCGSQSASAAGAYEKCATRQRGGLTRCNR